MRIRVWTWAAFLAVVVALALGGVALADDRGEIEFTGVVTKLPESGLVGDWKVNDITVHVTDATTERTEATHGRHGSARMVSPCPTVSRFRASGRGAFARGGDRDAIENRVAPCFPCSPWWSFS